MKSYFLLILLVFAGNDIIAQQIELSGTVGDLSGPLPGASVVNINTQMGVSTDLDGKFSLKVNVGEELVISYVGFVDKKIVVENNNFLNIVLEEDTNALEEVVVVGYGQVRKKDVTGSISSLKEEQMMETVVSSIDQGIQGKAAGVVVSFGSGQPGSNSSVRIRGISSITGTLEPLYVIDGVPVIAQNNIGAVSGPASNPLESLNPADVESVEILKDASATAIYGTRGANGVILITTKRGNRGHADINVGYSYGIQRLRQKIGLLNAKQLAELGNEAADNAGVDRREIYASPTNLGVGTDWQEEIFRLAPVQNLQISARGGNEQSKYSISGNYFDQMGIILNSKFQKGNFRLNMDQELVDRVKIGASINYNKSVLNGVVTDSEGGVPSSVTSWALQFNPGLPVYDENGDFTYNNNTNNPGVGNPVADLEKTKQVSQVTRLLGNLFLTWNIAEGLNFKTSFAGDSYFNTEKSFVPNDVYRGQEKGQAAIGESKGTSWLVENTLSYNKLLDQHRVNAVIGQSAQVIDNEFLYTAVSDFDDNRLGFDAIQAGAEKTLIFNGRSKRQLLSFLGRINYGYKDRYLATFSTRVDGSSVFGDGNKFGVFPALALAWIMSEESFLSSSNSVSNLKLKLGLGRVGNEGIPPYSSMGLLVNTEAYFGENEIGKGFGHYTSANEDLRWETTDQLNLGVDFGMFDNRINILSEVYFKKTSDLLLNVPVPYTSGYEMALRNIGNLQNKGVEFTLNTVNIEKELTWSTNFNISFNRNNITNLAQQDDIIAEPLLGVTGWTSVKEGQPIGNFYGYLSDGIVQLDENLDEVANFPDYQSSYGDRKYKDINNDGILNEEDKVFLGNANPDFSFGLGNNLSYKGWNFSFFFQGVFGNEIANFNRFALESFDGLQNNSTAALKRWTTNNPTHDYPRANADPRRSNVLSDVQVEDGSYAKLRDVTLSYQMKREWIEKMGMTNMKLAFSGKNLWVITNYSGYDPEVNRFSTDPLRSGVDYGSYPPTQIYTISLNMMF